MTQLWIISDGKPGHLNQSLGLAEALQRLLPELDIEVRPALSKGALLAAVCRGNQQPAPALIIAAGHRTHLSALALKRATGAPAVVMMKPSLPLGWFDLCLIPQHDQPAARDNVIVTEGALNRMRPLTEAVPAQRGMMLIGGPSKHFGWDEAAVLEQIRAIAAGSGNWLLTTSRRTPPGFVPRLRALDLPGLEIVPVEETGPGWLAEHLPKAAQCWVTGDSVSMVFEALTAGCAVGILELPQQADNRITRGLQLLIADKRVTPFSVWRQQQRLTKPDEPFDEASRCAELIRQRFFR